MTHATQVGAVATLYVALELSAKQWKVALTDGVRRSPRIVNVGGGRLEALHEQLALAKERLRLPADCRVVSCYEAGRDGWWLHRALEDAGIESLVVDPASLEVDRHARRAKSDGIDARKLLACLVRYARGEQGAWRVARAPDPEAEDRREATRGRESLVTKSTALKNTIQALLFKHGVRDVTPGSATFEEDLDAARTPTGEQLLPGLRQRLMCEHKQLVLVQELLREAEKELRRRLEEPQTKADHVAAHLHELKAIGPVSANVLTDEMFGWRSFKNRGEVGSFAGLTDTPYSSGASQRTQGISKQGNRRVRTTMIEVAWGWIRWQPDSVISRWFRERTKDKTRRSRRVAIVAVARKLLIALWHYVRDGVVPAGAIMRSDQFATAA